MSSSSIGFNPFSWFGGSGSGSASNSTLPSSSPVSTTSTPPIQTTPPSSPNESPSKPKPKPGKLSFEEEDAPLTPYVSPYTTTSSRLTRQLTPFLAGSAFLCFSILATRRSLARRRLSILPAYYHPSNAPPQIPVNGAMDAFEALNLSTLNVMSFGIMLIGGSMYALDICDIEELRQRVRETAMGEVPEEGAKGWEKDREMKKKEKEAEEDFEEWMVGVLARKEIKDRARERAENMGERES